MKQKDKIIQIQFDLEKGKFLAIINVGKLKGFSGLGDTPNKSLTNLERKIAKTEVINEDNKRRFKNYIANIKTIKEKR